MKSSVCANKYLETDTVLPSADEIEENRLQVIECYTQLPKNLNGGSLDFLIEPSNTENICLLESFLHLQLRVVKYVNGAEQYLENKDLVSYVPFISNSLFKGVTVSMNDEELTMTMEQYQAYEGLVNTILHLSREEQRTFLDGAGLFLSEPNRHLVTDPATDPVTGGPGNPALSQRHALCAASNLTSFTSPILWPLFLVPRILPTNMEMKISLSLNNPNFCLIAHPYRDTTDPAGNVIPGGPLPTYDIKIEQAQIYLQKYRLTPSALAHQERILSSGGARYPMMTNHTVSFNAPADTKEISRSIVLAGPLPRMVYVFQVERNAIQNINSSPYRFVHNHVQECFLEIDGRKFPSGRSYTPSYFDGNYQKDFRLFQRELNYSNKDMFFSLHGWDSGYNIYAFNLIPDRSYGCDYLSLPKNTNGTVTLHITYSTPLTTPNTIFVMMEHHKVLTIDHNRKPRIQIAKSG